MRGLYTATVINTLGEHFANRRGVKELDVGKGFDLIVGTSTGGILAASLAYGHSVKKVIELYHSSGPRIFTNPMPETRERIKLGKWLLLKCSKPANANGILRQELITLFQNETLEGLYNRRNIGLCIPSVKAENQTTKVFKTPHLPRFTFDKKHLIVDVCMATSAAPIFLPLVDVADPTNAIQHFVYADGGLWQNNPVLIGMLEALEITKGTDQPIEVISIGTCSPPEGELISPEEVNMGLMQWRFGAKIMGLSMNAQAAGSAFMAKLLQDRLRELGCNITVLRLESSLLSEEHMRLMRMDSATVNSLRALSQVGSQDGQAAIRRCDGGGTQSNEEYKILFECFNQMPIFN